MPRRLVLAMVVLTLAAIAVPAHAFNDEVLLLPDLAGWSMTAREATERGDMRLLRRESTAGPAWAEEIRISSTDVDGRPDTAAAITRILADARRGCSKAHEGPRTASQARGYAGTVVSLSCDRPATPLTVLAPAEAKHRLVMAKVIAGDSRLYRVVRTWEGAETSAAGSDGTPARLKAWTRFFDAVQLCSTLVEPCTQAAEGGPSEAPSALTQQALTPPPPPTLETAELMRKAAMFGRLTGRAEICGEDAKPLLEELDRIFRAVASSGHDADAAKAAFLEAREAARAAQRKAPLPCSGIVGSFRLYPTRLSRFAPYLKSL